MLILWRNKWFFHEIRRTNTIKRTWLFKASYSSVLIWKKTFRTFESLDTVNPLPFEFQKLGALKTMEKIVDENSEKKFVLNHTHAYPQFLPAKKGKVA